MKTILALFALLPCLAFGQGFGSFYGDQPYLAKSETVEPPPYYEYVRYDADALGLSDGDAVATFTDQGIYGVDLTQADSVARPYWTNNASEINNEGYVKFDGSDDYVTNTTYNYSVPFHVFIVGALPDDSGPGQTVFRADSGGFTLFMQSTKTCFSTGPYIAPTLKLLDWAIWELCVNGRSSYIRTNNVLVQAGTLACDGGTGFRMGRGTAAAANCKIAYTSVYNGEVDDVASSNIVYTLSQRFGITIYSRDELPSWNPTTNNLALAVYDARYLLATNLQVITTIEDLTPNGLNLRTTNSPVYFSVPGTNNGIPTICFNTISGTAQMAGTNYTVTNPQPTTVILVGTGGQSGINWYFDNCVAPGGSVAPQGMYRSDPNTRMQAGVEFNTAYVTDYSARGIYEFYFDGASSYVRTNGTVARIGNTGSNGRAGIMIAGKGDWNLARFTPMNLNWAGVYTNTLDATSRSNIYYFLGKTFNVTVSSYAP